MVRKYILHLSVLERAFRQSGDLRAGTAYTICLYPEVFSDNSAQQKISCMGETHIATGPWNNPFEVGHYNFDLTSAIEKGPILQEDKITVAASVYRGAYIFEGQYKNVFGSNQNLDKGNRPWIDIFDNEHLLKRLHPTGDTYFKDPESPPRKRGYEEILVVENYKDEIGAWRHSFVISFSLTGYPPIPTPPFIGETRIGIREL